VNFVVIDIGLESVFLRSCIAALALWLVALPDRFFVSGDQM